MAFKLLGRVLTVSDYDWTAVVENIWNPRSKLTRFSRILGQQGSYPWTSDTFYKSVVQATILFGLDTWVMTPNIGSTIGLFHHRVDRRLSVMQPKWDTEGRYEYLPLDVAMLMVGLEEGKTYVLLYQNTVDQYTITCPTLELCLLEKQQMGAQV